MAIAEPMEIAILDAVRQLPSDRLAGVLNYVRGLSVDGTLDPDVYAGITPGGMSFEIPPGQIKHFLCLLVDTLGVEQVTVSFEEKGGGFVEYTYWPEALELELDGIREYLTDSSFLVEFEGGALYAGGDGCFSLRASLAAVQMRRLIVGVLNLSGFDLYQHKEITGAALFDGGMVVYK